MNNKSFPIDAKSSNIRPMSFYEFMHCFERGFITLVASDVWKVLMSPML